MIESLRRESTPDDAQSGGSSERGPSVTVLDLCLFGLARSPTGRSHRRRSRTKAVRLPRAPEDDQVGRLARRRGGGSGRPSSRAGVGRDGGDRLLERPARRGQQIPQTDLEPLVRAGQVRCAGHDDLARRIDGPLAVTPGRQPGQRAGVADQDGRAGPFAAPARAGSRGRDDGRRR